MKNILMFVFVINSMNASISKDTVVFFDEHKIAPIIRLHSTNTNVLRAIHFFNNKTTSYLDKNLQISNSINALIVTFKINDSLSLNSYTLKLLDNSVSFEAGDLQGFYFAITDFFENHLIKKKNNFLYIITTLYKTPDFKYREVYFPENLIRENRNSFKTHCLDEEWGLWGHNLYKWVDTLVHTDSIYAYVDGKRLKQQFCFSSLELKSSIQERIQNISENKFIIAPKDNSLVCQCNLCLLEGNTSTNASPAVFNLLAQLGTENPKKEFWSLGYVSTKYPPQKIMPNNVGVLLSTIDCQEGIPLKSTKKGKQFLKSIEEWKAITEKIYIWDYAINFDNYYDIYPILATTQTNLKTYKELGVRGVFILGNENDYSIFEPVKYEVLSELLWNVNLDLKDSIKKSFIKNYPNTHSLFSDWYYIIDTNNFKKQPVYGSIMQAEKRYLSLSHIDNKINELEKIKELNTVENSVLFSLSFLSLELLRIKGADSWGESKSSSRIIQINSKTKKLIKILNDSLERTKKPVFINEQKYTLKEYLNQWVTLEKNIPSSLIDTRNLLNITTTSILDEDYSTINRLIDKAVGFIDYNDNWMLFSGGKLKLNLKRENWGEVKKLRIHFLSDEKHHIFLPDSIKATTSDGQEITIIPVLKTEYPFIKKSMPIDINLSFNKKIKFVTIEILSTKKTVACDEILTIYE